jgi:hypothetical protein
MASILQLGLPVVFESGHTNLLSTGEAWVGLYYDHTAAARNGSITIADGSFGSAPFHVELEDNKQQTLLLLAENRRRYGDGFHDLSMQIELHGQLLNLVGRLIRLPFNDLRALAAESFLYPDQAKELITRMW